jgi:hypothetical protein
MTGGMTQKGNRRKAFNIKALLHDKENKVTDILLEECRALPLRSRLLKKKEGFRKKHGFVQAHWKKEYHCPAGREDTGLWSSLAQMLF